MRVILFIVTFMLFTSETLLAQSGGNQLQLSFQGSLGTGDFGKDVSAGYGGGIKYMRSIGGDDQNQITLEGGYNNFRIKIAPPEVNPQIHSVPILIGYSKMIIPNFRIEPQAGVSVNKALASYQGRYVSASYTGFSWSVGGSYVLPGNSGLELGARFQNTLPFNDGLKLNYASIRIAYNVDL